MNNADLSPEELQRLIDNSIRELGHARSEEAQARTELSAMKKEMEESERWQTHASIQKEAKAQADELYAKLCELAIEYYELTDDKTAHKAAKVKIMTAFEYDRAKAKEWALENLPEALKLD